MGIREWPVEERPRERLLSLGSEALSDAELLAIFLRTGPRGRSAVELARDALSHFGDLRCLLEAEIGQYLAYRGLGQASFVQLKAAIELARRYQLVRLRRLVRIDNPRVAEDYLQLRLSHLGHEVFVCLFLDNQHGLIDVEEVSRGTIDGASVYPREVVKRCLSMNAAAVIFAHNHPSGIAEPSQADQRLTKRLQQALSMVDIRVLDHLVVGDGATVSFAERGLL